MSEAKLNPKLLELPAGRWTKVHEQSAGDAVTFRRQSHAGSAFNRKRGRIIIFGSDTHGKDWSNSPVFFDVATLTWSRLYPDDDPSNYRVNAEGIPVAGTHGDHPWAMHIFGSVEYDPVGDALIVSSYPKHLEPGRFTDVLASVWPQIQRHPTWLLDLNTGEWRSTVFDIDRRLVVGYKSAGTFELDLRSSSWKQVIRKGLFKVSVYDSRHKALVVFGSIGNTNDIVVYEPATKRHLKMNTPGKRPRPDQHNPMAFQQTIGRLVI